MQLNSTSGAQFSPPYIGIVSPAATPEGHMSLQPDLYRLVGYRASQMTYVWRTSSIYWSAKTRCLFCFCKDLL